MRSARNLYRLNLALAGVGGLAVMLASVVAVRRLDLGTAPAAELAAYCRRFVLPHLTPASALVLGLGLLGATAALRAVRSALGQLRACRRFLRALDVVGERIVGPSEVLLVGGSQPEAFCAGFVRPRIYISRAAVKELSPAQLEAVVAHEAHHARRRDPLRILVSRVLADAIFFLPVLRRLETRYQELAEIAADEAAVAATRDPSPLAAALLRFGQRGVPGVVGIAPERVDHLLGDRPRWRLSLSPLAGALVTLAALFAVAATTAHEAGTGSVSVTLIAAQSCMVSMAALPIAALVGVAVLSRRAASTRDA